MSRKKSGPPHEETNNQPPVNFEKSLKRIGDIVQKLEANDCELDEALQLFEEGVGIAKACHQRLESADKVIQILTKSMGDQYKLEAYQNNDGEE